MAAPAAILDLARHAISRKPLERFGPNLVRRFLPNFRFLQNFRFLRNVPFLPNFSRGRNVAVDMVRMSFNL